PEVRKDPLEPLPDPPPLPPPPPNPAPVPSPGEPPDEVPRPALPPVTGTGMGISGPGRRIGGGPAGTSGSTGSLLRRVIVSGRGTGTRPSAGTATVSRSPATASSATAGRIAPRTWTPMPLSWTGCSTGGRFDVNP